MDKVKLRVYDGAAIAGFLTLPELFYTGPGIVARESGQAAWIAVPVSYAAVLLLFLAASRLMLRHKEKDIIAAARVVMGKHVGALYGLLLAFYFCFSTGVFIREGAEILKIYGLRLTPVRVIAGLILLTAVIMNLFGGKSVVKSAGFFFVLILTGFAFVMLLGLNRYNADYLFPALGGGISAVAKSGRHMASASGAVIMLALFTPDFGDARAMRKSGVIALSVSAALSALFYLCFIMMFSAPVASKMVSGYMEMGKSIYYNHFFYRFESALLFFLIFSSAVSASLGLYIARKSVFLAFGPRFSKTCTALCASAVLITAFIPASLHDLTNHYLSAVKSCGIFFMAGPPLLLLAADCIKRAFKHEKS